MERTNRMYCDYRMNHRPIHFKDTPPLRMPFDDCGTFLTMVMESHIRVTDFLERLAPPTSIPPKTRMLARG